MNHFVDKYFNKIAGAGGKRPKQPDPPLPPTLKPPILGDLQAIASFEYAESIDLISDGPIDGLVSPDGRYVEDMGLFESIYLNDAPIKQNTSTNLNENVIKTISLSSFSNDFSGQFYFAGQFQSKFANQVSLQNLIVNSDPINHIQPDVDIEFNMIDGKDNISNAIYNSILELPSQTSSSFDTSNSNQQKVINDPILSVRFGKFNYNSAKEVSTFLLQDYPNKNVNEYPFCCLQIKLTIIDYDNLNNIFEPGDYLYLEDDIYNQTFLPLEAEELNKKIFLDSKRKISIIYPLPNGYSGSFFLFLYKNQDGTISQNSIDAVINNIKNLKFIKPIGKFNITNASCEVKTGEQLQRPLSSFQKVYSEKTYNTKLIGPFAVGRNVLRTPTVRAAIDLRFSESDNPNAEINTGRKQVSSQGLITKETYEQIKAKHSYFWTFADTPNTPNLSPSNGNKNLLLPEKEKVIAGRSVISLVELTLNEQVDPNDPKNIISGDIVTAVFELNISGKTIGDDEDPGIFVTDSRSFSVRFNIKTLEFVPFDNTILKYNYNTANIRSVYNPAITDLYFISSFRSGENAKLNKTGFAFIFNVISKYFDPTKASTGIKSYNDFVLEPCAIAGPQKNGQYRFGLHADRNITVPVSFNSSNGNDELRYRRTLFTTKVYNNQVKAAIGALFDLLLNFEGSDDNRLASQEFAAQGKIGYSSWAAQSVSYTAEKARPITHVIDNPNVDAVFVSVGIRALRDTAHLSTLTYLSNSATPQGFTDKKFPIGSAIPTIIRFSIECGYQDFDGNEEYADSSYPRIYEIRGITESPATIDIGRTENENKIPIYSRFILGSQNIAKEITLPPAQPNRLRFVRITRTTFESYSSLLRKEIFLDKVTEIINSPFTYPFSSICGLKLDARSISEIPSRSYDARFKKVFIPSNYFPLKANGEDKRYLTSAQYNSATSEEKIIYKGNWDGTFKFAWTDNPVWILFDLLINQRYGLGNFIEPTQINYWELYKIGRYCDSVDDDGMFIGVPSADGGYEPRYSFNGIIADKTNVFDMIKSIVSSFRGNLFYTNSEINFTNDRLKPTMAFFNNANVKDGIFTYTNDRKDLQYNVMEVSFLDRTDLFKEKIEYVEDSTDIKNRGILRNSAQTFGVTSRSHAQRIGKHIIYSTINEDQTVQFVAGLETLLCRPGDLIAINDEMRSFREHVGRVLEVDIGNRSILTNITLQSSDFSSSGVTGQITILIPIGKVTQQEFYNLAKSPSKLNIGELYKNDIPMSATFNAILTGMHDFGSTFYFNPDDASYNLIEEIKLGAPCSITLANTKQEIYKVASIKELNLNEYEVIATKFDTGKFAEIEVGDTLNDFYQYFPENRKVEINEGNSELITSQFKYDLQYPQITIFSTGNFDFQNDLADFTGSWNSVNDANCYDVELITPKYRSIKYRTNNTSINFEDLEEVGRFTLKVTARKTGVYPNLISSTAISGFTVVSYIAPIRSNGIVSNFKINTVF